MLAYFFCRRANDDPHGIFKVEPQNQKIVVTRHMSRLLRVNITRDQGLFDRVAVEFSVEFDQVGIFAQILNVFIIL